MPTHLVCRLNILMCDRTMRYTLLSLTVLLLVLMAVQSLNMREAFAASDGGALIQLAASRPAYYVTAVPV